MVSVTFMKGGDAYNVIPESASFGGTFRSLTTEGFSYLMKRIKEVTVTMKEALISISPPMCCSVDQSRFKTAYKNDIFIYL